MRDWTCVSQLRLLVSFVDNLVDNISQVLSIENDVHRLYELDRHEASFILYVSDIDARMYSDSYDCSSSASESKCNIRSS